MTPAICRRRGSVPGGDEDAVVKPPPRATDALHGALEVLLRDDALHTRLLRAERPPLSMKLPLAATQRVPGVALEQRRAPA